MKFIKDLLNLNVKQNSLGVVVNEATCNVKSAREYIHSNGTFVVAAE